MAIYKIGLALTFAAGLSACGDNVGEQALGGGAIGAGAAAITGGSLLTGAAIGAGANVAACQTEIVDCK